MSKLSGGFQHSAHAVPQNVAGELAASILGKKADPGKALEAIKAASHGDHAGFLRAAHPASKASFTVAAARTTQAFAPAKQDMEPVEKKPTRRVTAPAARPN